MIARYEGKQKMYRGVRDVLRAAGNVALWHDNPEALTDLVSEFEAEAGALGSFGSAQSQTITGVTQQQNQAETTLEDAAHPLARALRLYFRGEKNLADAAVWDLQLTDWRRLRENELLGKAKALLDAATPLTIGTAPKGPRFGITAAKIAAFGASYDAYDAVIGAPRGARSTRKAQTGDLPARFRSTDGILDDVDDLIIALRGQSAAHDLFVAAYFNARRIGGQSTAATTQPTAPTAPGA